MKIYGANDAAAELDTDPRTLRRFLRQDESYRNAGTGGRYMFEQSDIGPLKKAFNKWNGGKGPVKSRKKDPHLLDDDKGVSVTHLGPKGFTPELRMERRAARELRWRRLITRIHQVLPPPCFDEEMELEI